MSDQALPGRRAAPPVETLPPRQRLRELLGSLYEHHAKAESFRRDRIAAALEHIQRIATSALEVGVDERARNGEVELEMDLEALHRFLLNPDLDTLGDAQRKRA